MLGEKAWTDGWLDDEGWIGHSGDKAGVEAETRDIGCVQRGDVWGGVREMTRRCSA